MNLFFPDIFWMFLSQGNLKTICFILNWNKTIFCNVGRFGKSVLTYPTPGRELRADCELWDSMHTSLSLALPAIEGQFWECQDCTNDSGYPRSSEAITFPRSRTQFCKKSLLLYLDYFPVFILLCFVVVVVACLLACLTLGIRYDYAWGLKCWMESVNLQTSSWFS